MEERLQEKEGKNVIGKALDFRKLKKENFLVIFLVGILLLVIAWPAGGAENGKEPSKGYQRRRHRRMRAASGRSGFPTGMSLPSTGIPLRGHWKSFFPVWRGPAG